MTLNIENNSVKYLSSTSGCHVINIVPELLIHCLSMMLPFIKCIVVYLLLAKFNARGVFEYKGHNGIQNEIIWKCSNIFSAQLCRNWLPGISEIKSKKYGTSSDIATVNSVLNKIQEYPIQILKKKINC